MATPTEAPTEAPTKAPTYTPNNQIGFNITVGLGSDNKEVTITADDISQIPTKGIAFQLPPDTTVELGSLSEFIVWLNGKLTSAGIDVSIPTAAGADWPDFMKNIFNGVLNATVTVQSLLIKQSPKDSGGNYPPLIVQLSVTATANPPISIISGLFSVVGGGISLNRTYTTQTP